MDWQAQQGADAYSICRLPRVYAEQSFHARGLDISEVSLQSPCVNSSPAVTLESCYSIGYYGHGAVFQDITVHGSLIVSNTEGGMNKPASQSIFVL